MKEKFVRKSAVDLTDLAIAILALGIITAIGANIMLNFQENRILASSVGTSVNVSTPVVTDLTAVLLGNWVTGVTHCLNNSASAELITAGNYTFTQGTDSAPDTLIMIRDVGDTSGNNNTAWDCTITEYNSTEQDMVLSGDAATGLGEYGNWFDIIVIVGIAGLILALLFMAFGRGGGDVSY